MSHADPPLIDDDDDYRPIPAVVRAAMFAPPGHCGPVAQAPGPALRPASLRSISAATTFDLKGPKLAPPVPMSTKPVMPPASVSALPTFQDPLSTPVHTPALAEQLPHRPGQLAERFADYRDDIERREVELESLSDYLEQLQTNVERDSFKLAQDLEHRVTEAKAMLATIPHAGSATPTHQFDELKELLGEEIKQQLTVRDELYSAGRELRNCTDMNRQLRAQNKRIAHRLEVDEESEITFIIRSLQNASQANQRRILEMKRTHQRELANRDAEIQRLDREIANREALAADSSHGGWSQARRMSTTSVRHLKHSAGEGLAKGSKVTLEVPMEADEPG
jgi:hypothetical protein